MHLDHFKRNPLVMFLAVLGIVGLVYGLWNRDLIWIISGAVVLIVGKLLNGGFSCCKAEEVKPVKKKKRRK